MTVINEGDRVVIKEIGIAYAQRRHVYNQMMWTASHALMLAHVGIVTKVNPDRNVVTVVVFCHQRHPKNGDKMVFKQLKTDWPAEALETEFPIFFTNDHVVALTKGSDKMTAGTISSLTYEENQNVKYTILCTEPGGKSSTAVINGNPQPGDNGIKMLPIYEGSRLNTVMKMGSGPIHTDKNLLHGYTVGNLLSVVRNWQSDTHSYAALVETIKLNCEQVRDVIDGESPLLMAVAGNNWDLVTILIALKANKFTKDSQQNNMIHVAAQRGFDSMLEGVLRLLPKDANAKNSDGDTPLHLAARNAHAACIDRLLAVPYCNSCIQNDNGDTPIHEVCKLPESASKKASISRLLVNPRVSIYQPNNMNLSPIQISMLKGHAKTVDLMLKQRFTAWSDPKTGMTTIHFAASCGDVSVVNVILALEVEVHKRDKQGRGVLHYAVEKWTGQADKDMGRLACIQALVHAGAPLNAVDSNGRSVIHSIVLEMCSKNDPLPSSFIPICVKLVRANMNLGEISSRLRPHWHLATICFLVSNGSDVMLKDRRGETVVDICTDVTLRNILVQLSTLKMRSCLPMQSIKMGDFDESETTICTFMCQDQIANVKFMPCGHRVICKECARQTRIRRCPLCYQLISSAIDQDGEVVIRDIGGGESDENVDKNVITEQYVRRIAEEAAREAKEAVEQEKQTELKTLKEKLELLEMETSCSICMDLKITIVFNCGHTSCSDCSTKLKQCHICRQAITSKQTIYS